MIKIVWVIGQSAAGKETFIKYAVDNPDSELIRQLKYNNSKIIPLLDYKKDEVLNLISKETNAVILIKWQHYNTGYDFAKSDLSELKAIIPTANEIICLSVESDTLYARLFKKPWFDKNEAANFTQEKMNNVVEIMRNNIRKYLSIGFALAAEIDATDGYKIIEHSLLKI
ncbi:MAG: hypothetical protein FWD71_07990 [Oscillospiraceae bacterium]|nr:hypothetical protein [Oscillospiraceae bacterium]